MIWQDIWIAIISLLFGFIMIPQLRDSLKGKHINSWSSGLTMTCLYLLVVPYVSLNLWFSIVATLVNAIIWTMLFVLSIRRKNVKKT